LEIGLRNRPAIFMIQKFDTEKIDVEDYLHELGLTGIYRKGNEYWFSCPLSGHMGADNTPSASMEVGTTRMHCFGCNFSGNAVTFLAEYEGVSNLKARQWLRDRFGMGWREPEDTFSSEIKKKLERMENKKNPERNTSLHSTLLNEDEVEKRSVDWYRVFDEWQGKIPSAYPLAYMLDRGFHPKTLDEWAIGWDIISQRISIPVRDDYGNLLGFKARAVDNSPQRYKVLGGPEYGFETYPVTTVLFGIHLAKKHDTLIIREGELNVIAMHEAGVTNTVGVGKHISDTQLLMILKYANKGVLVSFDDYGDSLNAARMLEPYLPVKVFPPSEKDPADMFKDELYELITAAESSVLL
jgi:DNA primase